MSNVQIRHNVFETNSSSSHSVTVGGEVILGGEAGFGLSKEILREGKISFNFANMHLSQDEENTDVRFKFATALTAILDAVRYTEDAPQISCYTLDEYKSIPDCKRVIDIFESTTGVKIEAISGEFYFESTNDFVNLLSDDDIMKRFLFSDASSICYTYD